MSYTQPAAYDQFMGRWSAGLTPSFLRFADLRDGQHVLDVGCGTGSLSRAVVSLGPTTKVTALDPAPEYVAFARQAVPSRRAQFEIGTAEALPFPDRSFVAALALLVLQEFADPRMAICEMARVTRAGGIVAACQWDFDHGLPMFSLLWQAAEAVAPEVVAKHRKDQSHSPRSSLAELDTLWQRCGLSHVTTATLELSMHYTSFEDYWEPFLSGATPTSAFAASLNALTGGGLARVLREKLPAVQPDGSFVLPALAWAIADDLGYKGNTPFPWDEDRRALLRAELDARIARLYGLTRDQLRYILDPAVVMGPTYPSETFRVLKKNELDRFGEYRTRRLVLDAWDRLERREI
jgi:SAM-dependent methyltransferase